MNNNMAMKQTLVFISHNKADKDVAREITLFLAAENINVWFDEWGISAGDSIIQEINTGLRGCTHFIILWSKNASTSNWVRRELQSMLAKAIQTGSPRVLPILLDKTPLPELLSDIRYIKFHGEREEERREIIEAISSHRPLHNSDTNGRKISVVDWRITSDCDYNCPCCFGPKGISHLDLKNAKDIVDRLYTIKVQAICISGGEPLIYPYIDDILSYIHDKGINIYLSTNGNHFWEHKEIIEKYVSKLSLPLDGYSQEIHARNGRNLNNFTQVNTILKHYTRGDVPFQIKIGTLLTSTNITVPSNLINIFDLLKNYSIDIWKIYEFVPEGKAVYNRHLFGYYEEFFSLTVQSLHKAITVVSPFPIVISRRKERNRAYFIIQPNGDVVIPEDNGEIVDDRFIGNILTDSLNEIIVKWKRIVDFTNYQRNVRIVKEEEYPVVLDRLDREILAEFGKDPTQTYGTIGKKLSVRADIVDDRIKFLHERGILKNVIPIIDVDKLGFFVFNVFLAIKTTDDKSQQRILNYLLGHSFIPWVASCRGKWTFVLAIFAKTIHHCREMMMDIENACENKLETYNLLPVYEKYILGQRYLFHNDKVSRTDVDKVCRISLDRSSFVSLAKRDYATLAKITGHKRPSIFDFSNGFGKRFTEIAGDVEKLKKIGILKAFLPTCDISLLGYEWYIVLIKFKNLTEARRLDFINYISSYPQITHIICCIGNWDVNFEIHARDNKEFRDIYLQIKNKFANMIDQEDYVTILKEHKFNFLVDSIFEGLSEVK